jgi:acyl carrier protein
MTGRGPDLDELRAIVADVLDVEPAEVTDEADFVADLRLDSLIALEVTVALERRYGVRIDEDEIGELTTLGAVHALLGRKLAEVAS